MGNENKIYLDKKGYEQYLKEIDELRNRLQKNGKDKSSAFVGAVGDGWHDNFEFEEAKREELRIGVELQKKLDDLTRIEIIDTVVNENKVDIDDYVLVEMIYDNDTPENMIFKLVGASTPNFKAEIAEVSLNSPIGKAVYQKKVGDRASYTVNGFTTSISIINKANDLQQLSVESAQKKL